MVARRKRQDASVDDSAEILSYRGAVLGSLAGIAIMGVWLWCSGIPAWIAPLFVFSALVILVGLARIVAEAGLPTVVPAMVPPGFVISAVGVPALGVKGVIATGYTLIWIDAVQNTMLDTALEISATAIELMPTRPMPQEYPASRMGV